MALVANPELSIGHPISLPPTPISPQDRLISPNHPHHHAHHHITVHSLISPSHPSHHPHSHHPHSGHPNHDILSTSPTSSGTHTSIHSTQGPFSAPSSPPLFSVQLAHPQPERSTPSPGSSPATSPILTTPGTHEPQLLFLQSRPQEDSNSASTSSSIPISTHGQATQSSDSDDIVSSSSNPQLSTSAPPAVGIPVKSPSSSWVRSVVPRPSF